MKRYIAMVLFAAMLAFVSAAYAQEGEKVTATRADKATKAATAPASESMKSEAANAPASAETVSADEGSPKVQDPASEEFDNEKAGGCGM